MKFCNVQGCYSNNRSPIDAVDRRFYQIPLEGQKGHLWQTFTGNTRKYTKYTKNAYICDKHFSSSDYISSRPNGKLKKTAIPSINGPTQQFVVKCPHANSGMNSFLNSGLVTSATLHPILLEPKPIICTDGLIGVTSGNNKIEKLIQLDEISEAQKVGDQNYSITTERDPNNGNVLMWTSVSEQPDFIKKKVRDIKKIHLISPITSAPKLISSFENKYAPKQPKKTVAKDNISDSHENNKSSNIPIAENIKVESDLTDISPSKITSGLMAPIDLEHCTDNEELTTMIQPLEEGLFKEYCEKVNVQEPENQESRKRDENGSVFTVNLPKRRSKEISNSYSAIQGKKTLIQGLMPQKYEKLEENCSIVSNCPLYSKIPWESFKKKWSQKAESGIKKKNHKELRKQDEDGSLIVKFNSYLREQIDTYLDQQQTEEENLSQINNDVEIMSESSEDSVVYLIVGDEITLSDNRDSYYGLTFTNHSFDSTYPLNSNEINEINNTTQKSKTTPHQSIISHSGLKKIMKQTNDGETSNVKCKKDMCGPSKITKEKYDLVYDENGVLFLGLEPSLNSPIKEITRPSERRVYTGISSHSAKSRRGKGGKSISFLDTKCLPKNIKNETIITPHTPFNKGEIDSGVDTNNFSSELLFSKEIKEEEFNYVDIVDTDGEGFDTYLPTSVDRSSPFEEEQLNDVDTDTYLPMSVDRSSPVKEEQLNDVDTDTYLPMSVDRSSPVEEEQLNDVDTGTYLPMSVDRSSPVEEEQLNDVDTDTYLPMSIDRSSPIDGISDDLISADESCNQPSTSDKSVNPKASVMREHLKQITELSRKRVIKKYSKPKFPKRMRLLQSKYTIAAHAESLGTFNSRDPSTIPEPVDLEKKSEWHKLYSTKVVNNSFPRLNEAYISKMVNVLRARLHSLETRDQLEVSFLLSLMSAYPGAPEYVKELLTQRLNILYIATLFQWDTALSLAAKGHNESGPVTDLTVPSIPLAKHVSRVCGGTKNLRINQKYYCPSWKTDKIVVPMDAVNLATSVHKLPP